MGQRNVFFCSDLFRRETSPVFANSSSFSPFFVASFVLLFFSLLPHRFLFLLFRPFFFLLNITNLVFEPIIIHKKGLPIKCDGWNKPGAI